MAQEVSKADGAVFDGGASQPATTLLQVRIDVANAQVREALLICVEPERRQEPQRMLRALGSGLWTQSTQIAQPRVVVLHHVAVKGFECGGRRLGERPSSVHKTKQHVNGTGVSVAPFAKRRRLAVPSTEELILPSQELRNVHRSDSLRRYALAVAVVQEVTCEHGIPPLDRRGIRLDLQVMPQSLDQ